MFGCVNLVVVGLDLFAWTYAPCACAQVERKTENMGTMRAPLVYRKGTTFKQYLIHFNKEDIIWPPSSHEGGGQIWETKFPDKFKTEKRSEGSNSRPVTFDSWQLLLIDALNAEDEQERVRLVKQLQIDQGKKRLLEPYQWDIQLKNYESDNLSFIQNSGVRSTTLYTSNLYPYNFRFITPNNSDLHPYVKLANLIENHLYIVRLNASNSEPRVYLFLLKVDKTDDFVHLPTQIIKDITNPHTPFVPRIMNAISSNLKAHWGEIMVNPGTIVCLKGTDGVNDLGKFCQNTLAILKSPVEPRADQPRADQYLESSGYVRPVDANLANLNKCPGSNTVYGNRDSKKISDFESESIKPIAIRCVHIGALEGLTLPNYTILDNYDGPRQFGNLSPVTYRVTDFGSSECETLGHVADKLVKDMQSRHGETFANCEMANVKFFATRHDKVLGPHRMGYELLHDHMSKEMQKARRTYKRLADIATSIPHSSCASDVYNLWRTTPLTDRLRVQLVAGYGLSEVEGNIAQIEDDDCKNFLHWILMNKRNFDKYTKLEGKLEGINVFKGVKYERYIQYKRYVENPSEKKQIELNLQILNNRTYDYTVYDVHNLSYADYGSSTNNMQAQSDKVAIFDQNHNIDWTRAGGAVDPNHEDQNVIKALLLKVAETIGKETADNACDDLVLLFGIYFKNQVEQKADDTPILCKWPTAIEADELELFKRNTYTEFVDEKAAAEMSRDWVDGKPPATFPINLPTTFPEYAPFDHDEIVETEAYKKFQGHLQWPEMLKRILMDRIIQTQTDIFFHLGTTCEDYDITNTDHPNKEQVRTAVLASSLHPDPNFTKLKELPPTAVSIHRSLVREPSSKVNSKSKMEPILICAASETYLRELLQGGQAGSLCLQYNTKDVQGHLEVSQENCKLIDAYFVQPLVVEMRDFLGGMMHRARIVRDVLIFREKNLPSSALKRQREWRKRVLYQTYERVDWDDTEEVICQRLVTSKMFAREDYPRWLPELEPYYPSPARGVRTVDGKNPCLDTGYLAMLETRANASRMRLMSFENNWFPIPMRIRRQLQLLGWNDDWNVKKDDGEFMLVLAYPPSFPEREDVMPTLSLPSIITIPKLEESSAESSTESSAQSQDSSDRETERYLNMRPGEIYEEAMGMNTSSACTRDSLRVAEQMSDKIEQLRMRMMALGAAGKDRVSTRLAEALAL